MKISKTKLRQIIKEELGTLREEDPAEETALNSPSEAGRQWEAAKMNLTTAATAALEDGLSPRDIRNAIEEILSSAPDEGPRFVSTGPWAPEKLQEEGRTDQGWLDALKQKYGRKAAHFTVNDIQKLHPSYKGSLRDIAQGLGIR